MKLLIKIGCVLLLIILLQIPLFLTSDISDERQNYRETVISEISQSFGMPQQVVTPTLEINYKQLVIGAYKNDAPYVNAPVYNSRVMTITPANIEISGDMHVERKNRRIYATSVYSTAIDMMGVFKVNSDAIKQLLKKDVVVEKVYLTLSISDPKGIKGLPEGSFNGARLEFAVSKGSSEFNLKAEVPLVDIIDKTVPFDIRLPLNGTKSISIVPTGLESKTALTGNWPHPSFFGEFLPETREVTDTGFSAMWMTTWLSGQLYSDMVEIHDANEYAYRDYDRYLFGVSFINLVDIYSLVDRSIKYGFLIIALTFLVIFVLEMLTKCRIHPVQYGLIGVALVVFFLLLLSLSEQIPFGAAYLIAAAACVALITFYIYFSLKKISSTALFSGFLVLLYLVLYMLLNVSDYALLLGSGLIFTILAAVLIATRTFNWYEVNQ